MGYKVKIITHNINLPRHPMREESKNFDTLDSAQEYLYTTASQYMPCEWVCGYIYNRANSRAVESLTARDLVHHGKTSPYKVIINTASGLELVYRNVQACNPAEAIIGMRSWWQQYHNDDKIKKIEVKKDAVYNSRNNLNP